MTGATVVGIILGNNGESTASPDSRPLVEVDGLEVSYGGSRALDAVTLSLDAGSSLALVGPNGSGKTTLLQVMAGLVPATSGALRLRSRTRLAYVLQRHDHHRWMPLVVDEVARMGRYAELGPWRRLRPRDHQLVEASLERLGVTDLRRRQFGELSGGQRQRVLVAQALAQEPDLLLLDEPITGLDIPSQDRILELVDELTSDGVAVVLSTHHLVEARRCDRVALLDGRLIALGPPDEALTPASLAEAFAGGVLTVDEDGRTTTVLDEHGHGGHDDHH